MFYSGVLLSLVSVVISVLTAILVAKFPKQTPVIWMLFFQSFFSLFMTLMICKIKTKGQETLLALKTQHYRLHVIRAILGLGIYGCYYEALHLISPLNSNLLINAAPLFLPLLNYLFFKQRLVVSIGLGITLGFTGIYYILDPSWMLRAQSLWGYTFALCSGLCFALTLIVVNRLNRYDSINTIIFYYTLHGSLLTLMILSFLHPPLPLTTLGLCLIIALMFCMKQYAIAGSLALTSPIVTGMLNYLTIVLLLFYEVEFKQQHLTVQAISGIILVISGVFLTMQPHRTRETK